MVLAQLGLYEVSKNRNKFYGTINFLNSNLQAYERDEVVLPSDKSGEWSWQ